jgi:hypothetical protein
MDLQNFKKKLNFKVRFWMNVHRFVLQVKQSGIIFHKKNNLELYGQSLDPLY